MNKILHKILYFGNLPADKVNIHQKNIRDAEWEAVKKYIHPNSLFLDVGCGIGYNLQRAMKDFNCKCVGIDPDPGSRGVRYDDDSKLDIYIGLAETLQFKDKKFDVVFSSHVLEHVSDKKLSLREMKRVLKDDGIIIIGVPTATMACIRLISMLLFTTHHRIAKVLLNPFIKDKGTRFIHMFFPPSHGNPDKTILEDILEYRIVKWSSIISSELKVVDVVLPGLYFYPDYIIQLNSMKKSDKYSSSSFFICKK